MRRALRRPSVGSVCVVAALLLAGCAKPSAYKEPVGKFRDSSGVVIQATKTYLNELNKVERDEYIYNQAGNRQQIVLRELESRQVFSAEGIRARLKALDELANYTELLYQLANSTAPQDIKSQASDLQKAMTNLSGEIKTLTGKHDEQFKAAAGKAMPIIGDILQAFAEQKIESALKKAIQTGAGPVNDLISAIESDAQVAYERKKTEMSAARVVLIDQYNREFEKGPAASSEKLKQYADAISAEEDRWESFLTARPGEGLEAMKTANNALANFAATPKPTITDFATFVDAMEAFADTAKRVGQSVQSLQKK